VLGVLLASRALQVNAYLLKTTGVFLIVVDLAAYAMAFDGTFRERAGRGAGLGGIGLLKQKPRSAGACSRGSAPVNRKGVSGIVLA